MKYNQPFDQPSNPTAPYVDGNPSAGIQGSIVPAAAVEYPQREIMAAISAAGLAGTNADLTQLLQMLKIMDVFNKFKFSTNSGNASQWSATVPLLPIMPPPAGTTIWFKPGFDSVNGGTVFSVNGSSFMPVTNADGTPISIGDVLAFGWVLLFFDGTEWLIVAGTTARAAGVLPLLQHNTAWYVNGSTGDDTLRDGTSATVGAGKIGPFKTIQRASDEVLKYNMNNYNQSINIADGTYTGPALMRTLNGTGAVAVIGNISSPQNVTVTCPGTALNCAIQQSGGFYSYNGLRFTTPAGALDGLAVTGGLAVGQNLRFGPCARFHMSCGGSGASLQLQDGQITIEAGANCQAHLSCQTAGYLTFPVPYPADWPSLNILGAVTISSAFIQALELGVLQMKYSAIGGAAFVTGSKYNVYGNAIIDSLGGGTSYYPGSSAGTATTGGQYMP